MRRTVVCIQSISETAVSENSTTAFFTFRRWDISNNQYPESPLSSGERHTWRWIHDLNNLAFCTLLCNLGSSCRSGDLIHPCLGIRSESEAFRPRKGLDAVGPCSGSGGLPLWRFCGVGLRPLSRRGSCPWWVPKPIINAEDRGEDTVRIVGVICTHSKAPSLSPLSINPCHFLTTSFIPGRLLGFCCQQLSRSIHMSLVSPTS